MGRLRGLALLVCAGVCFLVGAAEVAAAGSSVNPYRIQKIYNADGSYAYTEITFESTDIATGKRQYITRNVPISAASIGRLAGYAMRYATPVGVGLTAYSLAKDFLITKNPGIEGYDVAATPLTTGDMAGNYWRLSGASPYKWGGTTGTCNMGDGDGAWFFTSPHLAAAWMRENYESCTPSAVCSPVPGTVQAWATSSNGGVTGAWTVNIRYMRLSTNYPNCDNDNAGYTTNGYTLTRTTNMTGTIHDAFVENHWGLSLAQLGQLLTGYDAAPGLYEQQSQAADLSMMTELIAEALRQGYYGLADELTAAASDLAARLDPESETYDATIGQTAQQTEAPMATAAGGSFSMEFPGFCEWAAVVCTFLDWFTGEGTPPEDVDVPFVEVEDYDEVTVGDGSYTCPGVTNLGSFAGQALNFSWALPCEFATAMRPIVLLVAAVTAVLVLVGWRGAA